MNPKNLGPQVKLRVQRGRARFGAVDIAVRTFRRFSEDDAGPLAAALTYYMFFSIFPLLLVGASVLGYLTFGNDRLREDLLAAGLDAAPLLGDVLSPDGLAAIESNRGGLAITGLLLALYSGSGGIVALEHALDRIHRVGEDAGWFQKRLRSLRWLPFLGAAAVLSLAAGAIASFAGDVLERLTLAAEIVATTLARLGGVAVNVVMFGSAFKLLPHTRLSVRDVLPGAIAAAIAFEVLKLGGTWYLAQGESARNDTFGAFAGAAALLVASYLLAQITLLAAELNAVVAERRIRRGNPDTFASQGGAMDERLRTRTGPNGAGPEKSAGQLMKEVTQDLSTLVRKEVQLAKEELGSAVAAKAKGGVIVAVAGVFAFFALIFLLLAVRDGLDTVWPTWLADIVTALLLLTFGGVAVMVARKMLATPLTPELTKKTIKEDVEFAKTLGRR